MFMDPGLVMPHAKEGRMRPLAVTTAEPSALAPGLPTVAASGLPGYEWVGISGIWAPAKTPAAVIGRVNQEIAKLLARPEVRDKIQSQGVEVAGGTPQQLAATVNSETAKVAKVIKDAGIPVE
jgi:tripartite-type tricarboxylate transporter receptor subunit TctC